MKNRLLFIFLLLSTLTFAQRKPAFIQGTVTDDNDNPLTAASVIILGEQSGVSTNDSGKFRLTVPSGKPFALIVSHSGYYSRQQNFLLNEGEEENLRIRLQQNSSLMEEVVIQDERMRRDPGLIRINPKAALSIPTPVSGVESLIKIFTGSNNELTSGYNVRGGNFDENLIYVNDFEIFRPYLVRSGQQEGLSFINPELVRNINFYNGGFGARYGDKMSSVLDIQYQRPQRSQGSAYISLLEQGFHLGGAGPGNKFSYLIGLRNRSNQNLLRRQPLQGSYRPASSDLQSFLTYSWSQKVSTELLLNFSRSRFSLEPSFTQLTSSVISPFQTANLGIDIYFNGAEKDEYTTAMAGLATSWQIKENLGIKILASAFRNEERENIDIAGAYIFGDRDFDPSSSSYGLITNPLGAGIAHNWARNELRITNYNLGIKGWIEKKLHYLQWGLSYDKTTISDRLHEWEYIDSAGYSLPYKPDLLALNRLVRSRSELQINKWSAYLQDNLELSETSILQLGIRMNYNSLNEEFIYSPRISYSWKPAWKRNIIFKAAAGLYHQPPFYRELRNYEGNVDPAQKAQKSAQVVLGADYSFAGFGRPLRFTAEAYYKHMYNTIPYDIDNVRIRYYGDNTAKAFATGLELRLYGELVKDAESWISLGFMRTKEDLENDIYTQYTFDSSGSIKDSAQLQKGWVRRPTDRFITLGMFFQDYLSTNKNFRVYLNTLYGSNLPYNIPGNVQYRNALRIEPYIRVDIGFSAQLLREKDKRRSHAPFQNFQNIWINLEVFNLLDRDNTISYLLVKDFSNNIFTLPNRLTPRLLNLKLIARW